MAHLSYGCSNLPVMADPDIARQLGVARSIAYQWVRHLPFDRDSERARQRRLEGGALFVEAAGRSRHDLRYRVSIHENADAEAAG